MCCLRRWRLWRQRSEEHEAKLREAVRQQERLRRCEATQAQRGEQAQERLERTEAARLVQLRREIAEEKSRHSWEQTQQRRQREETELRQHQCMRTLLSVSPQLRPNLSSTLGCPCS